MKLHARYSLFFQTLYQCHYVTFLRFSGVANYSNYFKYRHVKHHLGFFCVISMVLNRKVLPIAIVESGESFKVCLSR